MDLKQISEAQQNARRVGDERELKRLDRKFNSELRRLARMDARAQRKAAFRDVWENNPRALITFLCIIVGLTLFNCYSYDDFSIGRILGCLLAFSVPILIIWIAIFDD